MARTVHGVDTRGQPPESTHLPHARRHHRLPLPAAPSAPSSHHTLLLVHDHLSQHISGEGHTIRRTDLT